VEPAVPLPRPLVTLLALPVRELLPVEPAGPLPRPLVTLLALPVRELLPRRCFLARCRLPQGRQGWLPQSWVAERWGMESWVLGARCRHPRLPRQLSEVPAVRCLPEAEARRTQTQWCSPPARRRCRGNPDTLRFPRRPCTCRWGTPRKARRPVRCSLRRRCRQWRRRSLASRPCWRGTADTSCLPPHPYTCRWGTPRMARRPARCSQRCKAEGSANRQQPPCSPPGRYTHRGSLGTRCSLALPCRCR